MKDGKPVTGPDGQPELAPLQPLVFPQGFGRLIPGFDQGFAGMHIGGKRRIFVPWQLAYGTRNVPAHGADHPNIPPKSDLIFDVELLDVTDMPAMPTRPMGIPPRPGAVTCTRASSRACCSRSSAQHNHPAAKQIVSLCFPTLASAERREDGARTFVPRSLRRGSRVPLPFRSLIAHRPDDRERLLASGSAHYPLFTARKGSSGVAAINCRV